MSESDLEREVHRRGQALMRKLLQGHLDGVERSERRVHECGVETTFGTVAVERVGRNPIIDVSEHWVTVTFPRPVVPVGEKDTREIRNEPSRGPDSEPESGLESSGRGPESAHSGQELMDPGLESTRSGPEPLERRVLALLLEGPLSKSAIADGLGHRSVSAGLNRVVRCLLRDGRVAYTVPHRPNSRLQKYRVTQAGRTGLEEPAK